MINGLPINGSPLSITSTQEGHSNPIKQSERPDITKTTSKPSLFGTLKRVAITSLLLGASQSQAATGRVSNQGLRGAAKMRDLNGSKQASSIQSLLPKTVHAFDPLSDLTPRTDTKDSDQTHQNRANNLIDSTADHRLLTQFSSRPNSLDSRATLENTQFNVAKQSSVARYAELSNVTFHGNTDVERYAEITDSVFQGDAVIGRYCEILGSDFQQGMT